MNKQRPYQVPLQRMRPTRRGLRSAFTLIEAVISMTIISSTMVTAVGLVTLAQQSSDQINASRLFRRQVQRFAHTYREDTQRPKTGRILLEDNQVALRSTDRIITYSLDDISTISRMTADNDQPTRLLETYDFGKSVTIEVVQPNQAEPLQWIFTHDRFPGAPVRIIATTKRGAS